MENTKKEKVLQPHAKDLNPQPEYVTVVRPNYCQSRKVWFCRVINQLSEQVDYCESEDKEIVILFWKEAMLKYHKIENPIL